MILPEQVEVVPDFTHFGVHAFTTGRAMGSFGTNSDEPVRAVMARWYAVRAEAASHGVRRIGTAAQVHGSRVLTHTTEWEGWLRGPQADGHVAPNRGTATSVTIADCVPVFLAHPSGATAVLHSGWRGTAARIVEKGIAELARHGCPPSELIVHLGPAICGRCYEVSPDVLRALTGEVVEQPRTVDLRALIAEHARRTGVRHLSISDWCTRHHNDRFFSHRAGDSGRQIGVIFAAM